MAINVNQDLNSNAPVRVIAKVDEAIDHSKTDWDDYKETGDESKLVFLPDQVPTVFVCNFNFDAKAARIVNNAMMAGKDDQGAPQISYGSWAQAVSKVSLKEVLNPPNATPILLRKDGMGYVHDELIGKMEKWGVLDDIFSAYIKTTKSKATVAETKNS